VFVRDEVRFKQYLQLATAASLVMLVAAYSVKFGAAALSPAAIPMSSVLLLTALCFLWMAYSSSRKVSEHQRLAQA
jgi:glucose-6-phosphate-specific signal transduction histidine kinase